MSEMLGNHYFMVGNYSMAVRELSLVHRQNPRNVSATKKLIIARLQLGEVDAAFQLFVSAITMHLHFPAGGKLPEFCPCQDLIQKLEAEQTSADFQKVLSLAILWYFKDLRKSKYYFQKLAAVEINNSRFQRVLKGIEFLIPN